MVLRLLLLLVVLLGLHAGYQFADPEIRNYLLEGKMKQLVKEHGMKREREFIRDTLAFAKEKGIPLTEKDIVVEAAGDRYSIAAHYKLRVEYWIFERDYEFFPASSKAASLEGRVRRASSAGVKRSSTAARASGR